MKSDVVNLTGGAPDVTENVRRRDNRASLDTVDPAPVGFFRGSSSIPEAVEDSHREARCTT